MPSISVGDYVILNTERIRDIHLNNYSNFPYECHFDRGGEVLETWEEEEYDDDDNLINSIPYLRINNSEEIVTSSALYSTTPSDLYLPESCVVLVSKRPIKQKTSGFKKFLTKLAE